MAEKKVVDEDGFTKKKSPKKEDEDQDGHGPTKTEDQEPTKKESDADKYYRVLYKEHAEAESKSSISPAKTKRSEYLSWDNYFMALTYLSAERSPDPSTQVGACIVDPENRIVGMGHNAMPVGLDMDQKMPWNRFAENESFEESKYPYVCHAAVNAILSSSAVSLKGCTLYCTIFPGHEDAKLIIQSGISKVVYYEEKHYKSKFAEISRRMLRKAGVSVSHKWWDKDPWKIQPETATTACRILILPSNKSKGSDSQGAEESASDCSKQDESEGSAPEGSTQGADESKESAPEGSTQGADESKESAPEGSTQGADENKKVDPRARDDFLRDEAYFMAVALVSAERSKDPSRQVGACIVNKSGNIVGVGYNRFPKGFGDDDVDVTWEKGDQNPAKNKYPYVCHAEANAIVHKSCIDLEGCTIYTTYFPCNECAKLILQSKIKEVVYLEGQESDKDRQKSDKDRQKSDKDRPKSDKDRLYLKTSRKLLKAAGFDEMQASAGLDEQPAGVEKKDEMQAGVDKQPAGFDEQKQAVEEMQAGVDKQTQMPEEKKLRHFKDKLDIKLLLPMMLRRSVRRLTF